MRRQRMMHRQMAWRLLTPQILNCYLLVFKGIGLFFTVIILITAAIIPAPLTADHVWNCNDSPENECARLMLIPIFFSVAIILYDIVVVVLTALGVMHMAFVIGDGVLAFLISMGWLAIFVPVFQVSIHFRWRPMTTTTIVQTGSVSPSDQRDNRELPNTTMWFMSYVILGMFVFIVALLVGMYRMRQAYLIVLLRSPLPPDPMVANEAGIVASYPGPAEQNQLNEPIEPITKEEKSGPIKT